MDPEDEEHEQQQGEGREVEPIGDLLHALALTLDVPCEVRERWLHALCRHVGIAVGRGTDVAADAADVVLLRAGVLPVVDAVEVARATMRTVRQNLWWAFGYNAVGIPLAAGVLWPVAHWVPGPMFAAVAMSVSSVAVVGNSLRLRRLGRA